MKTIVITSGYFNPIHPWHIECLELCKDLGDELWVIVNNDEQVKAKTGKDEPFQNQEFRIKITSALKVVDEVVLAVDQDGSVCESIRHITQLIKSKHGEDTKIVFGKWGDRFAWNIPEVQVCEELKITIKDGLWAKTHNSSDYRKKA
jgi:D-beta-D-heptose 7-phosphate kinase/D-beta-D-heptose 1-phosphate adenosyltransferase